MSLRSQTASYSWFDVVITKKAPEFLQGDDAEEAAREELDDDNEEEDEDDDDWTTESSEIAPIIRSKPDGSLCKYHSHNNTLRSLTHTFHHGAEFGPDHEIWEHLSPGDSISVYACAKYGGWRCHGAAAELKLRIRLEPVYITGTGKGAWILLEFSLVVTALAAI